VFVGPLNLSEQVNDVVGLAEVVLNVVVFRRDAQLYELILERAGLLKKAMDFSLNRHAAASSL
jgi:hypothetical protein